MKILIIDDSLLERKLLASTIKKAGLENEVLQAGDGEEGITILSQNIGDVACILLDWQMPKMNGIDFMKSVQKVPEVSSIPIIMITASSSEDSKKLARDVNPDLAGYLVKPYKPEKLIEMIQPLLNK